MTKRWTARALVLALVLAIVAVVPRSAPAHAAVGADFNPGNIISDAAFYDGAAMSASQIQEFLNSKVRTCASGATCLKDYRQNTPTMPANAYCTSYSGQSNESAASILARVGQVCGISQKVLLVLLQKEQSLVTLTNPSATRYAHATGFACPDSAPCDPSFSGFFYQVYYAARQFQRYAAEPTRYNYRAGRVNNILFHPNTACGASGIYIVNKATAGLYNYTPYQPNAAALANLYGTGDGCSSYGNRNFWRLYSDWFGSPTLGTSLLRTPDNATVYVVTDTAKYPIPSIALLTALAPLGGVGYVSQDYLSRIPTGPVAGRSFRDPGGTIYFYDRGTKLPFQSCNQVADYGSSCASDGYMQFTDAQAAAFQTGPVLSSVLGTTAGARYFIDDGTKSEILDELSQTTAGLPPTINVLTEDAVSHLAWANPTVRDGVFIGERTTGASVLLYNSEVHSLTPAVSQRIGVHTRTAGVLHSASIALLPTPVGAFTGVIDDGTGDPSLLEPTGRWKVTAGGFAGGAPVAIPVEILDTYPLFGHIGEASFIKAPSNGSVYIVMADDIRPISSWAALLALTSDGDPQIIAVSDEIVESFTHGPVALTAGTLYRTPQDATVYFIDGVTTRVAFSSFIFPLEAGFDELKFTSTDRLNAYPLNAELMTFGFQCDADRYVAAGGALHRVPSSQLANFPLIYVPMDRFTCGQMTIGADAVNFVRTPNGAIYQLVGNEKRKVPSMQRYAEISGGQAWMNVSTQFVALYSDGPPA